MAKLHRELQIEVVITKDYCVWMLNRGTVEVALPAGELFGFHMGAYVEAPVSQAASCQTSIPWLLEDNKTPVILVRRQHEQDHAHGGDYVLDCKGAWGHRGHGCG